MRLAVTISYKNLGQSTMEYAIIIIVVVAALVAMNLYMQRSVMANLKTIEEQINAERRRNLPRPVVPYPSEPPEPAEPAEPPLLY